jgi:cytochrome c oxidase assembly protein Cox11
MKPIPADTGNNLSVTFPASGTAQMNWSFAPVQATSVIIVVIDIVARTNVASFSTNQSSATVTGLKPGHLYQFKVQNGASEIIVEDWVP